MIKVVSITPYQKRSEGRRSKIRIYFDILKLIQRKGGIVKPTHILYGANLSHKRLKTHLEWLENEGFIERVGRGGGVMYRITEKGSEFVKEFRKVEEFSEAFGVEI